MSRDPADPTAADPTAADPAADATVADVTVAEVTAAEPLDPHDQADLDWLNNVYQGDDARQLSVRSIVTGMLIGAVMSISNLYVGLKTGWGLGVTVTACVIAYAVFRALEAVVPAYRRNPFTILENYTMSSAASAAGYMSSAGLVSAIPALYLATGRQLTAWEMMSWLAAISVLGVFMAVPLKRQLINVEKLPFPEGIATAETLRSMHTAGAEAMSKARSLFGGAILGALVVISKDALPAIAGWLKDRKASELVVDVLNKLSLPGEFPLVPGERGELWLKNQTIGIESSTIMVAAGAIMGIRVGVSLLVGAIFFYGVLAPELIKQGWAQPGYRGIVNWTLWPATAMMLTSGLLSFALRWRTVLRAFRGLAALVGRPSSKVDPLAHVEVPASWFIVGVLLSGTACVVLGHYYFEVVWWVGIIAVAMTFVLSIVAARATGETGVTPIGAMGKITQLMLGAMAPGNATANLMGASITAGAAAHSADLLTDLKSGYLLGGNPRKQTISQLFGVLAGTLVCVPVYQIVVDPEKLGSPEMPAPSAKVWEAVARLFVEGFDKLRDQHVLEAVLIGGAIGIVLTLLEEFLPQRRRRWVPSATGLGIAGVVPAFNSISMFAGALLAWFLSKARPKTDAMYTVSTASGLIAGESLMGVFLQLWQQGPSMVERIWDSLRG